MKPIAIAAGAIVLLGAAFLCYQLCDKKKPSQKAGKISTQAEKAPQFTYSGVLSQFKNDSESGDPLAKAVCGYANMGLKNFNAGESILDEIKGEDGVKQETVDRIFKSEHPFFRFMQGYCYEKGLGVDIDLGKAYESFAVAAQNLPFAKAEQARCIIEGKGTQANQEKGIEEMSSVICFSDAKVKADGIDGANFRTCMTSSPRSAYPPAALSLAKNYLSGAGVPKSPDKAMECCLIAYANGMESADKAMNEIFETAFKPLQAEALEKAKSIDEKSPEYQAEVKRFQMKNKCLANMPDLLAKETAKHMKGFAESRAKDVVTATFVQAGWLLGPAGAENGGMSMRRYEFDKAKCIDDATAILSSLKDQAAQPSKDSSIQTIQQLKSLEAIAKANGLDKDDTLLNVCHVTLAAKANDGLKKLDQLNIDSALESLRALKKARPSVAELVLEWHLESVEREFFIAELESSKEKLNALESEAPVKKLEYINREHRRFDQSKKTALELEANNNCSNNLNVKDGKIVNKADASTKTEKYFRDVTGGFAVSVNDGEAKNVTREEFGKLKSSYDTYLAEKLRLTKLTERNSKALTETEAKLKASQEAIETAMKQAEQDQFASK